MRAWRVYLDLIVDRIRLGRMHVDCLAWSPSEASLKARKLAPKHQTNVPNQTRFEVASIVHLPGGLGTEPPELPAAGATP